MRGVDDPFDTTWTPARSALVDAFDALAKVSVRRYPGGKCDRPDAERRTDERAIVDACAEVVRAARIEQPSSLEELRRAWSALDSSWRVFVNLPRTSIGALFRAVAALVGEGR